MPAGSPPVGSVRPVAPEPLHRPDPATYVMPDGRTSVRIRLVAADVPALEYDKVTVIGAAEGDVPLFVLSDLVTFTTEA